MKLTIIQVGQTPALLRDRYTRYPTQFQTMFAEAGAPFTFETVYVLDGAPLPDPSELEGIIITGSAAGVYEDHDWLPPLRAFIKDAYGKKTSMLGICFGHQIMADALGGDVNKSPKGWGLGRHVYDLKTRPTFWGDLGNKVAIAASHQDQVLVPPKEAEVMLSSSFTPNAGLIYHSGRAVSMQPHPEFDVKFATDLIDIRRGNPLTEDQADAAAETFAEPLDSIAVAKALTRFFMSAS